MKIMNNQTNILKQLEQDLPVTHRPFLDFAKELGISEDELLDHIAEGKGSGVIRRYGGVLGHRHAGFVYNVMVVFDLPLEKIDTVGSIVALKPFVSHCYERQAHDDWPYNFYAMVHAKDESEGSSFIEELKIIAGECPMKALKSGKEYKKTSLGILDAGC
jgi:siroheme decarboxylase